MLFYYFWTYFSCLFIFDELIINNFRILYIIDLAIFIFYIFKTACLFLFIYLTLFNLLLTSSKN